MFEAWGTFVVTVNDGAATLVAGHGASTLRTDDSPITSLTVVFLKVAHTPYFTEAQIKNRLLVDHHRSLACCQLQTKRHAVLRMSADGFGCLRSVGRSVPNWPSNSSTRLLLPRCPGVFKTLREWAEHYGPAAAVPTRLAWSSVRLGDDRELVFSSSPSLLVPKVGAALGLQPTLLPSARTTRPEAPTGTC